MFDFGPIPTVPLPKEAMVAYIRAGLQRGFHLYLPPKLYGRAIEAMRSEGFTPAEMSRVHMTEMLPHK